MNEGKLRLYYEYLNKRIDMARKLSIDIEARTDSFAAACVAKELESTRDKFLGLFMNEIPGKDL